MLRYYVVNDLKINIDTLIVFLMKNRLSKMQLIMSVVALGSCDSDFWNSELTLSTEYSYTFNGVNIQYGI